MSRQRWSLGGDAVLQSLVASGLAESRRGVYLRETHRPELDRPAAVLAQNALTVAPPGQLRTILAGSPVKTRAKTAAMVGVARVNLKRARRIVVLSHTMAGYVEQAVPGAGSRLVVCPVTLPLDLRDHATPALQPREPVVAVIGSVSPHKDFDTTIRALARAAPDLGLRHVVVYGEPTDASVGRHLTTLAGRLGIDLRTTEVGRADLLRAVSRAAVVVVPGVLESLGLALPEACVATSAVAATDIPAHRELAARLSATVDWFAPGDVDDAYAAILAAAARETSATPVPTTVASEWRAVVDALDGLSHV